ncbi:Imm30 family immunity protein [Risungbinella massiliensis]|uniref:Imm30 family immunity protein n=1 Tax=Risungbinella massiliensis TaxID=1329796 RepID=UPI0011C7DE68|nr:Imm30 family immunity protein [Risungbinella massiliensis]
MTVNEKIKVLYKNRYMKDEKEFNQFVNSLDFLSEPNWFDPLKFSEKDIKDIYTVFEDDTESHDVMFGLLHLVEALDLHGRVLIHSLPTMYPHALNWLLTFVARILNSIEATASFKENYAKLTETEKLFVHMILQELVEDSPIFFERVKLLTETN